MALTRKEREYLNQLQREEKVIQDKINSGVRVQLRTLEKLKNIRTQINELGAEELKRTPALKKIWNDIGSAIGRSMKEMRKLKAESADFEGMKTNTLKLGIKALQTHKEELKGYRFSNDLVKDQAAMTEDIVSSYIDLEGLKAMEVKQNEAIAKAEAAKDKDLVTYLNMNKELIGLKRIELEAQRDMKDSISLIDAISGDFFSNAKEFSEASGIAAPTIYHHTSGNREISKQVAEEYRYDKIRHPVR